MNGSGSWRPTPRELTGIALACVSYLVGWPAVGLLGVLSVRFGEPLLLAVGGPSFLVLSHLLFAAGLYLAGSRRIADFVRRIRRSRVGWAPGRKGRKPSDSEVS